MPSPSPYYAPYIDEHRYSVLVKSGKADALATAQDLSSFPAIIDQDIQDAIEELKRSTFAIEKQTENLRLQQNAMNSLVTDNAQLHQAQTQAKANQLRSWDMERGKTMIAVSINQG